MYWSVMLVAACVGAGNPVSEVAHSPEKAFDSYTTAWNTAKDLKRPMLVILNPAAGESGTQSIDGERLLANEQVASQVENYVVAVIDTSTEHGKKVNELFGSKALPRVVVIDKDQKHLLFGTSGVIPESRMLRFSASIVMVHRRLPRILWHPRRQAPPRLSSQPRDRATCLAQFRDPFLVIARTAARTGSSNSSAPYQLNNEQPDSRVGLLFLMHPENDNTLPHETGCCGERESIDLDQP